jgi:hypothetical protein
VYAVVVRLDAPLLATQLKTCGGLQWLGLRACILFRAFVGTVSATGVYGHGIGRECLNFFFLLRKSYHSFMLHCCGRFDIGSQSVSSILSFINAHAPAGTVPYHSRFFMSSQHPPNSSCVPTAQQFPSKTSTIPTHVSNSAF